MHLDRLFARSQLVGDLFVQEPARDELADLTLPACQTREPLVALRGFTAATPALHRRGEGSRNGREQLALVHRLDQEVHGTLPHVDTAPAFGGTGVNPIVHAKYSGGDIVLPDDPTVVLSPKQFPYLAAKSGDDIITGGGTTLLGADDKAGVAIIMAAARHLLENRQLPHGRIRIGFTPDEEIGRGVHANLPADLDADVAYTLDGAELGEIVYETFSADKADVHVQGVSIHPGQAKDKLVNALHLAAKIVDTLPQVTLTPETTSGRQGFIHLYQMSGSAASADLQFILRDFELDGLRSHGELLQQVCATVQATEPRARITYTMAEQYRNMAFLSRFRNSLPTSHCCCGGVLMRRRSCIDQSP